MASVGDDIKHCQSKSVLVPSWSWSSPLAGQPAAWAMPTTPSLLRSPPRTSPTNYLWPVGRLPRAAPTASTPTSTKAAPPTATSSPGGSTART
jgi:hypothetical protein